MGLGKIGLPLAAQYAARGLTVIGCDVAPHVVAAVNSGYSLIKGEPGLAEVVAETVADGRLTATTDTTKAVRQSDVTVVIVPLMIGENRKLDFKSIDAATHAIARGLRRDHLIIYETTLPVGSTRGRFGEMFEDIAGLRAGHDFWLAFSPERVYSGRVFSDLSRYPKIVGGVDPTSTARAIEFYRLALGAEVMQVASAELAELVKLIETTYRDVNIALANEFAQYAAELGLDITTAIRAANTQPYSHIHAPGIGVGGHCIPVYPYLLMYGDNEGNGLKLPRLARSVNDQMPWYAVDLLADALRGLSGRRVLILGLAYRENVKETAFTATKSLIAALQSRGAQVLLNDPLFSLEEIEAYGVHGIELNGSLPVDAVILQCYHDTYRSLDLSQFKGCRVVLDGRNVLDRQAVEAHGVQYLGIGR